MRSGEGFETVELYTHDKRFLRAAIWEPQPGTGTKAICVLLNGHGEFIEKYQEVAGELRQRGFIVVSLDWRNQGASEHSRAGKLIGHVKDFAEYDLDLAKLVRHIVDPIMKSHNVKAIALAHSMGAHILLRFLHARHRRRFSGAVLIAPMLEIRMGGLGFNLARLVAAAANLMGPNKRFVMGACRDPLELTFAKNLVTSDQARFERTKDFLRARPSLRIFGPSWSWLKAALASMAIMIRPGFARSITLPLLIFGAGRDRIVSTSQVRAFAKRAPHARYVEIAGAEHEILMERDEIRARFWAEFDVFTADILK